MTLAERPVHGRTRTLMKARKLFVGLVALLPSHACSDGEAGRGRPPPFELETFCAATCGAKAELGCPNDPSLEVCEDRCVSQLPTEGSSCYNEEIAILHCQFSNKDRVFKCGHSGKSTEVADVCDEEIRQAVINCGGL